MKNRRDIIMRAPRIQLLLSLLVCFTIQASEISRVTAQLPEIDAPPQGNVQWVARSMRLNGLPMTIKSFDTSMSVDDVLNFYEHWWSGKELAQYSRSARGEWRMLGIHSQKYAVTIEARATIGGSEGTITVSPKLGKIERVATAFPHPASAAVVNFQEYDDDGVEAEYISMVSPRDITAESSEFAGLLKRNGWQLLINRRTSTQADGHLIEAQKGAAQAQLIFKSKKTGANNTDIVVIWKKT